MDIRKEVGDRIRSCRKQREWTQEELAFRSGLHRSHIGEVERGESNVCLRTLTSLSVTFNVPPGEFFKGISVPRPKVADTHRGDPKKARRN